MTCLNNAKILNSSVYISPTAQQDGNPKETYCIKVASKKKHLPSNVSVIIISETGNQELLSRVYFTHLVFPARIEISRARVLQIPDG